MTGARVPVALVLTALLVTMIGPPAVADGVFPLINGISYGADDTNVAAGATVILYDQMTQGSDVIIPSVVNIEGIDYAVTTISQGAFRGDQLTSITIPNSVTTIRDEAFKGNRLTSVTIPDSVTTMGPGAFKDNRLTSVTLGHSFTSIGERTFESNLLTSVAIPASIKTIGALAFQNNRLASISLGNSVTTIGGAAFQNNGLTSVTIPNSVTSIGENAFRGNQLTSIALGASVDAIGSSAFAANTSLTEVVFLGGAPTTVGSTPFGDTESVSGPLVSYDPAYAGSGFTSPTWTAGGTQYRSQEVGAANVTPTTTDNGINPAIPLGIASLIALAGAAGLLQFRRRATT